MTGLEQVKSAVAGALEKAGVPVRLAWAPGWAESHAAPVVAVGLRTGESRGGALHSYLGQRTDPDTLVSREIYGLTLDLTLSLDVYSPPQTGTAGCDRTLEALHQVMLGGLPSGLRPAELRWEETVWDEDTSMFLRRGSLSCRAYFLAAAEEDALPLTDFILKGVVQP